MKKHDVKLPPKKGGYKSRLFGGSEKDKYLTELKAISPDTGELAVYAGPTIEASNPKAAEKIRKEQYPFCKIIGKQVLKKKK